MASRFIRLIRRFSRAARAGSGPLAVCLVLAILVVFLAACQVVPVSTSIPDTAPSTIEPSISDDPAQTVTPTAEPTATTTYDPTDTSFSSAEPTLDPSAQPSPTPDLTEQPSATPTATPSPAATAKPTPTSRPTVAATPTRKPTSTPTVRPTSTPVPTSTTAPTSTPTSTPTPTVAAAATFPFNSYGAFFRDEYGNNSSIVTSSDGGIEIDTGSAPQGVVLVKVAETSIPLSKSCKVIASANGNSYQYEILERNTFLGIPLQMGEGSYTINVYGQISGTSYYSAMAHTFTVELASSLKPYTASSVMVNFSQGSACVSKASSLCAGLTTTDGKVLAVYNWIAANISYDTELASAITSGQVTIYIPDPDRTYNSRKGICFDYASLMCAMLRSQGIPTRLAVGMVPQGYHAWNEVYFKGTGWVVVASFNYSYVDGSSWVMFDPTFAAGGSSPEKIMNTTHTKQKSY